MNLTFVLAQEEAELVVGILGKQPYEVVARVIAKLQYQANEQVNPRPDPKPQPEPQQKK